MNRSKTPLVLMEQLVMLLVFALAAAVCLRVFLFADQSSRLVQDRDRAAQLVQNTAETIRATGGDVEGALRRVSGVTPCRRDGFGSFVNYDKDWNALPGDGRAASADYTLQVLEGGSQLPGLGKATVEAYRWQRGELESLFSLEIAWQEVTDHGA